MGTTEKTSVLNDLIEINNDRVAGFEKALGDIKDENIDLKAVFEEFAAQSRKYSQELAALVGANAGEVETGNSIAGTLHRAWIDVKSIFGDNGREGILNEAERGEDAIKKAYKDALTDGGLSSDAYSLVAEQSQGINRGHDTIKALRDASK
ncbi:ferritin-like domain-containing protein [Mucilaginibacter ginkgonis]|uniref:PA2169 family four-helix-bundle protein n=1 Tax=Mucilaginibacter ginkgonis TaxID=2682091 RepID=A0A6I4IMS9_9SPHI|nr:PA2169 family four-helix-bundle protein [Mucilaginibacter ginkgonis]QQL50144.1 PA2169 family four-helix-bundle protein [Mucilaginibacter ginkgonis]